MRQAALCCLVLVVGAHAQWGHVKNRYGAWGQRVQHVQPVLMPMSQQLYSPDTFPPDPGQQMQQKTLPGSPQQQQQQQQLHALTQQQIPVPKQLQLVRAAEPMPLGDSAGMPMGTPFNVASQTPSQVPMQVPTQRPVPFSTVMPQEPASQVVGAAAVTMATADGQQVHLHPRQVDSVFNSEVPSDTMLKVPAGTQLTSTAADTLQQQQARFGPLDPSAAMSAASIVPASPFTDVATIAPRQPVRSAVGATQQQSTMPPPLDTAAEQQQMTSQAQPLLSMPPTGMTDYAAIQQQQVAPGLGQSPVAATIQQQPTLLTSTQAMTATASQNSILQQVATGLGQPPVAAATQQQTTLPTSTQATASQDSTLPLATLGSTEAQQQAFNSATHAAKFADQQSEVRLSRRMLRAGVKLNVTQLSSNVSGEISLPIREEGSAGYNLNATELSSRVSGQASLVLYDKEDNSSIQEIVRKANEKAAAVRESARVANEAAAKMIARFATNDTSFPNGNMAGVDIKALLAAANLKADAIRGRAASANKLAEEMIFAAANKQKSQHIFLGPGELKIAPRIAGCADFDSSQCQEWASGQECSNNPAYMLAECPVSCKNPDPSCTAAASVSLNLSATPSANLSAPPSVNLSATLSVNLSATYPLDLSAAPLNLSAPPSFNLSAAPSFNLSAAQPLNLSAALSLPLPPIHVASTKATDAPAHVPTNGSSNIPTNVPSSRMLKISSDPSPAFGQTSNSPKNL